MFFYGFYYVCMFLFYKLFLEPWIHCHCPPLKKNLFVAVNKQVSFNHGPGLKPNIPPPHWAL